MFHPVRMSRVLIGGHKARMQDVIDVLHKERGIHLEDYDDPTGSTTIGTPLDQGDEASELLVRTRGLLKALDADSLPGREMAAKDPAALLADAEAELGPVVEEAATLRSRLHAMRAEAEHLRPFSDIDAELSTLTSLRSVQGYMGTVRGDAREALDAAGVPYEMGTSGDAVIAIVPREHTETADAAFAQTGFSAVAVPEGAEGTPAQRIGQLESEMRRADERLLRAQQRLTGHRDQWGPRLAALERHLSDVVAKTQAPLRFAVTDTTFHIEGWVPADRANRLRNAISARFGDNVYFEELGDGPRSAGDAHGEGDEAMLDSGHDDHHVDASDEAPVKLRNRGLAKPYEFMLGLLGRPRYWELDPTKLMLIFFPLFFGLMVGDLLVGLVIMGFGLWLKSNRIFGIGGPAVGRALVMGGFIAVLAGAFVFGEALGIHFVVSDEALEEGEMSWEAVIYGEEAVLAHEAGFPTAGFFHKEVAPHGPDPGPTNGTGTDDNGTALAIAGGGFALHAQEGEAAGSMFTLAPHGTTHLKAGEHVQLGYYSKVHDIMALLIWSVIIAFVHLNLALMLGFRNVYVSHGMTLAVQEKASWMIMEVGAIGAVLGLLGWLPTWAPAAGAGVFVLGLGLLWVGTQKVLGVGFVAVLETLGFVGNFLSYTRLAAIGASKAGMALAFAAIGFEVVGGGDIQSIAGWIIYLFGMVVITLLAILSGGLQSLRLQFVESFQKFYTGGGRPYIPFGRRAP